MNHSSLTAVRSFSTLAVQVFVGPEVRGQYRRVMGYDGQLSY